MVPAVSQLAVKRARTCATFASTAEFSLVFELGERRRGDRKTERERCVLCVCVCGSPLC